MCQPPHLHVRRSAGRAPSTIREGQDRASACHSRHGSVPIAIIMSGVVPEPCYRRLASRTGDRLHRACAATAQNGRVRWAAASAPSPLRSAEAAAPTCRGGACITFASSGHTRKGAASERRQGKGTSATPPSFSCSVFSLRGTLAPMNRGGVPASLTSFFQKKEGKETFGSHSPTPKDHSASAIMQFPMAHLLQIPL